MEKRQDEELWLSLGTLSVKKKKAVKKKAPQRDVSEESGIGTPLSTQSSFILRRTPKVRKIYERNRTTTRKIGAL
jgi:hypothetical protein